jgi:hypothetical protein
MYGDIYKIRITFHNVLDLEKLEELTMKTNFGILLR